MAGPADDLKLPREQVTLVAPPAVHPHEQATKSPPKIVEFKLTIQEKEIVIDDAGTIAGLKIETDPKARLYLRKKAFLFGPQVKSRYGADGWSCTEAKPQSGEEPVGGVFLREKCTKTAQGRALLIERSLFRKAGADEKDFTDETRVTILRAPARTTSNLQDSNTPAASRP